MVLRVHQAPDIRNKLFLNVFHENVLSLLGNFLELSKLFVLLDEGLRKTCLLHLIVHEQAVSLLEVVLLVKRVVVQIIYKS